MTVRNTTPTERVQLMALKATNRALAVLNRVLRWLNR